MPPFQDGEPYADSCSKGAVSPPRAEVARGVVVDYGDMEPSFRSDPAGRLILIQGSRGEVMIIPEDEAMDILKQLAVVCL